jgi:serine/threonine protein phosphatase PrpC
MLEVSRAFGDQKLKPFGLTSDPEVIQRKIHQDDAFLILACDGLWKGLGLQEAADHVWGLLSAGGSSFLPRV